MGLVSAMLTLRNPRRADIGPVETEALVDTGSVYLIIPDHTRLQLALGEEGKKEVTLADGSKCMVPYVGPIEARFKNRVAFVGAIVMGDEVILGAIPMEDMDLVVMPHQRRIDGDPKRSNFALCRSFPSGPRFNCVAQTEKDEWLERASESCLVSMRGSMGRFCFYSNVRS